MHFNKKIVYTKPIVNWTRILLLFFSFLVTHVFSQSYNFRHFNSNDGLAQSYVYSITQDIRGYLWIGTGNGLSRYNGFVFDNFTTNDSLADNFVTCSVNDGECLWFGHMSGGISYFNGKKFHPVITPPSNTSPVTHFAKSLDGQIWVSAYSDGLLKLNNGKVTAKYNFTKEQVLITTFDFLNDSALLVGTNTGLLYCRLKKSGVIEIKKTFAEIPESKVTCIQKMKNKSGFFISTENEGIFRLSYASDLFKISKISTAPDPDFLFVQDVFEDSQSNLWLGSFGSGLIKINLSDSGTVTKMNQFNNANGFATNNVKTVIEDREGNIWSGNYGEGLTQITPKTFSVQTFDKKSYGNNIFSMYFNQQYKWVGTDNGLLKMDPLTGNIIRFYGNGKGLPKDAVTSIYSSNGKELWIGTERNGVFRMIVETEKISKYPIGNGTLENAITIITGDDEQIWIGTKKGLCNVHPVTNNIKWYTISKGGLPHNYINSLYLDRAKKLWVSTRSNILIIIQNEKIVKIPLRSVNKIFTLGPITEDADSRIWIGSSGDGVFMIEHDSIANVTEKEGLLSNYCYSLLCDDSKNIWVGHKGGLSRIKSDDFTVKPIQHIDGITDSCQFNPNAIMKDQQKKIWFGSDRGLVSYDPSMEYPNLQPPVLGITSIKVNDEEKNYSNTIILSPGNYKIKINYLGICLREPALVSYQFKLEGYEQWSEVTKNTSITFNHLKDGDYTFVLRAYSGDGIVSQNLFAINFIIKKSIWKKWWIYVIVFLLLSLLTFILIKRRIYILLTEKRILEEKVKERTHEIELQRDIIDERNNNITSSIEYALNIQNAILPPLDLIGRLLPDNFILSKPKDIVSGDFYWLAEKDNKIIFVVGDCTGHGIPGAFMSLLGITLLNEIVTILGITKSDDIVTMLREKIILSLQQSRKDVPVSDGMDITLCVLDKIQNRIQYTGGMNDLVYIRDRKIKIVKADRFSVCVSADHASPFTIKEFDCKEGDVFYLFSDGFQDQFGGDKDKKYLSHRLYNTFLEIHELPMLQQRESLNTIFNEWKRDFIQTDDITVMGIRL